MVAILYSSPFSQDEAEHVGGWMQTVSRIFLLFANAKETWVRQLNNSVASQKM